jgi:outer membrane protein assembly factor BamB
MTSVLVLMAACSWTADHAELISAQVRDRGGLVVHLGPDDGEQTADLIAQRATRVQALTRSDADAEALRDLLVERGLHGWGTVGVLLSSQLPYADNLVNSVVVSDWCGISPNEVLRVLVPEGRLYLATQSEGITDAVMQQVGFRKHQRPGMPIVYEKPRPESMDDWTHFLYNASGNAASRDTQIGVPHGLQWTAGPSFGRHHNRLSTVTAMVATGGRIAYILDNAPPGARDMPGRHWLEARDAFNGMLLWRQSIAPWGWQAWTDHPLPEYGFGGKRSVGGRFTQPLQLPRTLVAHDAHLYVTLGYGAPVSQVCARTGNVLQTYAGTADTDEILYHDGALVLAVHDQSVAEKMEKARRGEAVSIGKRVMVIDASSGDALWTSDSFVGISSKLGFMDIHRHLNPCVGQGRVFLAAKDSIVCLNLAGGKKEWEVPRPAFPERRTRYDLRSTDMVTLVYDDGTLFFSQLEPNRRIDWRDTHATLYAYSASDGAELWKRPTAAWGWVTPPDVWIIDDLVWTADRTGDRFVGLDPDDGSLQQEISHKKAFDQDHHHRCYRNKATPRFLLTSFHGMELFDIADATETSVLPWVRSVCRYGFLPANGLIYNAPDHCGCYPHVKLTGFNALSPAHGTRTPVYENVSQRTQPGAAAVDSTGQLAASGDWPAFRHDSQRTGIASCMLSSELAPLWTTSVGATPSAATIAGGRVYLAIPDRCVVVALDSSTGKLIWTHPTTGSVDTPPTYHRGTVLFGSAAGFVHCVRAGDGRPLWQFDAAPWQRFIMADGALESAWPVHGSVVVEDGKVYVTAGRSVYLDGGFAKWILDAATGTVLDHQTLDSDVEFLGMRLRTQALPGVKSDLLVRGGKSLFMRDKLVFSDLPGEQEEGPRLATKAGFLDGSLFNRTSQWKLGATLLGDYAVANTDEAYCWQLYAKPLSGDHGFFQPGTGECELRAYGSPNQNVESSPGRMGERNKAVGLWKRKLPLVVRAMVKGGPALCVAGVPDMAPKDDPWRYYEGRGASALMLIDAQTGETLAEHDLPSAPVYHGLAAAWERLFVCCAGGEIVCLADAP